MKTVNKCLAIIMLCCFSSGAFASLYGVMHMQLVNMSYDQYIVLKDEVGLFRYVNSGNRKPPEMVLSPRTVGDTVADSMVWGIRASSPDGDIFYQAKLYTADKNGRNKKFACLITANAGEVGHMCVPGSGIHVDTSYGHTRLYYLHNK